FTVTLTDTTGQTASLPVTFTVTDAAPTISGLNNVTVEENRTVPPVTLTVGDDATPAANLVVTVSTGGDAGLTGASVTGTGATRPVTLTLAEDREGVATVTITVNDGTQSTTANATVTVTPAPVPDPPTNLSATRIGGIVRFTWQAPASGAVPTFYVVDGGTGT